MRRTKRSFSSKITTDFDGEWIYIICLLFWCIDHAQWLLSRRRPHSILNRNSFRWTTNAVHFAMARKSHVLSSIPVWSTMGSICRLALVSVRLDIVVLFLRNLMLNAFQFPLDIDVSWIVDAKKSRNPRMFFLNEEGKNIRNSSIRLSRGKTECRAERVYIVVRFTLSYSIVPQLINFFGFYSTGQYSR